MKEEREKLNRVKPVIKARKAQVQKESQVLASIREEKITLVQTIKEKQKLYMDGVDQVNHMRMNPTGIDTKPIEDGLDVILKDWSGLVRQIQTVENKEKAQRAQLAIAERDLKAIEILEAKYFDEFRKAAARSEQKVTDEFNSRKYTVK